MLQFAEMASCSVLRAVLVVCVALMCTPCVSGMFSFDYRRIYHSTNNTAHAVDARSSQTVSSEYWRGRVPVRQIANVVSDAVIDQLLHDFAHDSQYFPTYQPGIISTADAVMCDMLQLTIFIYVHSGWSV